MKRILFIGLIAACVCGCGTVNTVPLDDAYYWLEESDSQTANVKQTTQSSQTTQTENTTQTTFEYLNIQDTTITVRVKK